MKSLAHFLIRSVSVVNELSHQEFRTRFTAHTFHLLLTALPDISILENSSTSH